MAVERTTFDPSPPDSETPGVREGEGGGGRGREGPQRYGGWGVIDVARGACKVLLRGHLCGRDRWET